MKMFFGKKACPNCGKEMDQIDTHCPDCSHQVTAIENGENPRDPSRFSRFERYLQVSVFKQIAFFLAGFLGFNIIGFIVALVFQTVGVATYDLRTADQLKEYLSRADIQFWINMIMYLITFAMMALLTWKKGWKEIARSFKKPSAVGIAFLGLLTMLAINFVYSYIITLIFMGAGIELPGVNTNESTLRTIGGVNLPLFIVVIGILGPFIEELTYRAGLFSFLSRINRWIAYVVSGLVFGLIHFSWDFSSSEAIIRELINLPTYVGAGLIMAFVYEKGGFAASFMMHSMNNIYSIVYNFVQGNING